MLGRRHWLASVGAAASAKASLMTPTAVVPPDRRQAPVAAQQVTSSARFPRILLVNQDRAYGRLLREALSFHGLNAILEQEPSADSALRRLATFSRWKIRLVLIALPLLHGGLGLISDIRSRSLVPAVPMFSLDDGAQSLERAQALRLGADDCQPRPQRWDEYGVLTQRLGALLIRPEQADGAAG